MKRILNSLPSLTFLIVICLSIGCKREYPYTESKHLDLVRELDSRFVLPGRQEGFYDGLDTNTVQFNDDYGNELWTYTSDDSRLSIMCPTFDGGVLLVHSKEEEREIRKIDHDGNLDWSRNYGDNQPYGIAAVSLNNSTFATVRINADLNELYIDFYDSVDFIKTVVFPASFSGSNNYNTKLEVLLPFKDEGFLIGISDYPYFNVLKVDNNGNEIWRYNGEPQEAAWLEVSDIIVTEDGGALILLFEFIANNGIYLNKIKNDGSLDWTKHSNLDDWSEFYWVVENNEGMFFTMGTIADETDCSMWGGCSIENRRLAIAKFNSKGNKKWLDRIEGYEVIERDYGMFQSNNAYPSSRSGPFVSSLDELVLTVKASGQYDYKLLFYDEK